MHKSTASVDKLYPLQIVEDDRFSKVQQIVLAYANYINSGQLKNREKLPSINRLSKQNNVSRDTVEKAYKQLRKEGHIASFPGRGYYVLEKRRRQKKVVLIVDKLSLVNTKVYEKLMESAGEKVKIDLRIHHRDPGMLIEILEKELGRYDCYAIIPHFKLETEEKDILNIINMIPAHELILIDRDYPILTSSYRAVYHDFKNDIYEALLNAKDSFHSYKSITLISPGNAGYLKEIEAGVKMFCGELNLRFYVRKAEDAHQLRKYSVYLVMDDVYLSILWKMIAQSGWQLRKDVGIISFTETVMKEMLGITVVSRDFDMMGQTAAKLILENACVRYKNAFKIVHRYSL